jgi:hypothetical protein
MPLPLEIMDMRPVAEHEKRRKNMQSAELSELIHVDLLHGDHAMPR